MSAIAAGAAPVVDAPWSRRLRALALILAVWGGLSLLERLAGASVRSARPPVILANNDAVLTALLVALASVGGACLGRMLFGAAHAARSVALAWAALALWAAPGQTIDEWLLRHADVPGPPRAAPYLALIPDYVLLGLLLPASAYAAGAFGGGSARAAAAVPPTHAAPRGEEGSPVLLILATSIIAALLLMVLTGPRTGATYRGQVYFAVAVAFYGGTLLARRLTGGPGGWWMLAPPLIVGLVGIAWAATYPGVPGVYAKLDMIPAIGFARPLPIEMIAVGVPAAVLAARRDREA